MLKAGPTAGEAAGMSPRPPSSLKYPPWPPLRAGDLIGFSSFSLAGAAINLGTWGVPFSGLSHVAIIVPHPDLPRRLALCESTSQCDEPCLVAGKAVSGVQWHEPASRIAGYRGRAWLYPLRRTLGPKDESRLARFCLSCTGVSYDAIGALRARDLPLGWLERRLGFWRENLHALFCSELCAAALRSAAVWDPPDVSGWSPNRLCRALLDIGVVSPPIRLHRKLAPLHLFVGPEP